MQYEILGEGLIAQRAAGGPDPVACGPRAVVTPRGELLCSYNVQSALGINDFKPMLSRSTDGGLTWREQGLIGRICGTRIRFSDRSADRRTGRSSSSATRTPIDQPGETFWSESTLGMKANELIWARSVDDGWTWTAAATIPMPISGTARGAGAAVRLAQRPLGMLLLALQYFRSHGRGRSKPGDVPRQQ